MFIQINIGAMQALSYNQINNVRLNKVMEQLSSELSLYENKNNNVSQKICF